MNSLRAVIFDLDGVLCSTDYFHYQAWKQLADRLAIPFDEAVNSQLRGVSRMDSLDIILRGASRHYTDSEKESLAAEKNDAYRLLLSRMTPADLPAEVLPTLHTLRRAGLLIAVGSSSRNTPFILERLGLANYFDAVADGNCISRSKPNPEVFLRASEMLCLPPQHCLVVEDAHAGVEAAVRGGFPCAAMGDARDDSRAMWHIDNIGALPRLLDIREESL